jgi:hypothetical protein
MHRQKVCSKMRGRSVSKFGQREKGPFCKGSRNENPGHLSTKEVRPMTKEIKR